MNRHLLSISLFCAVLAGSVHAQPAATAAAAEWTVPGSPVTLLVSNQSPRFLAWYEAAKAAPDADARWALWETMYGEAAVPPTPQGRAMARRLVDGAWPRYEQALPAIRTGAAVIAPQASRLLNDVARTLELTEPARIRLRTIVSGFEDNAFAFRADVPVVVIPLESSRNPALRLAHEGTHAVHMLVSGLAGKWERSLAATALLEGVAMHASCQVTGGGDAAACIGVDPANWQQALAARRAMLAGARAELSLSDGKTVAKYTMGQGTTGMRREAYYIGWWVVAKLVQDGMMLAQIARVQEADIPGLVDKVIAGLLAGA